MAKKSYQLDKDYEVTASNDNLLPKRPAYITAEEGEGFIRVTLAGKDPDVIGESTKRWFHQGVERPIQVIKVWLTDTDALGIVGSYDSNAGV